MYIICGLFIGFIAAVPFGPINVFAISQTLKRDFAHGFLVGLTAAVLDVFFCLAAITGIYHLVSNVEYTLPHIKILGVIIITFISGRLVYQAHYFERKTENQRVNLTAHRPIIGAFLLYMTNPGLYAFWLAIGGTVTAHKIILDSLLSQVIFALACGVGTLIWYFLLVRYVSKYHHQFSDLTFKRILLVTAGILVAIALYTTATLFV